MDTINNNIHSMVKIKYELEKNHPDTLEWIYTNTQFLPTNCKFSERLYLLKHNIQERPKFRYSNNYMHYVNFFKGYGGNIFPTTREIKKIKSERHKKFEEDQL